MLNKNDLEHVFENYNIDFVIHFASLKAIGESVSKPLLYHKTNITMMLNLLEIMQKYNCNKIIFSSSATVYGSSTNVPFDENAITGVNMPSPYGKTKYFQEEILKDVYNANKNMTIVILRYFNPAGAHQSGLIGELPTNMSNNLIPCILKVILKQRSILEIYGDNYDTNDGTCIRDYIHVIDVAEGHVVTLQCEPGLHIYNLGCGLGTSVLELIKTFKIVNNIIVPYKIVSKREGDIPICYSSAKKIYDDFGWYTKRTLEDICRDSYNFIKLNNFL